MPRDSLPILAILVVFGCSTFTKEEMAHARYQEALRCLNQRDLEGARTGLNQSLETSPSPDAYLARATIHRIRKEMEHAIQDYSSALAMDPNHISSLLHRATLLASLRRFEEAERDYRRALELQPNFVEALLHRSQLYREQGRLEEAERDLNMARERGRQMAMVFHNEAVKELNIGSVETAIRYFTFAVDLNTEAIESLLGRGTAYYMNGRLKESLADLSHALKRDPGNAAVIALRGRVYLALERMEEALADFQHVTQLRPNAASDLVGRGEAYRRLKRLTEAQIDFARALELDPELAEAYAGRAALYTEMNLLKDAEDDYRRALSISATSDSLAGLGTVLAAKNDFDRAIDCYRKAAALATDPQLKERYERQIQSLESLKESQP